MSFSKWTVASLLHLSAFFVHAAPYQQSGSSASGQGDTQVQRPGAMSEADYRRAELDLRSRELEAELRKAAADERYREADLKIKREAVVVEHKKAVYTAAPILFLLATVAASIYVARRTVIAQFTVKAAELALQGEGPPEIKNRAALLAQLHGDLLPRDFPKRVHRLQVAKIGRVVTQAPWTSDLKKEMVQLLSENPDQRVQILKDYKAVFPKYRFIRALAKATLNPPNEKV